ncbi:ABC transporter permease [Streptomyces colonosanans]|uniref:ABC transporter permease n=1 Tax=Streptomyces colonosanans TaxID=1428652 RepID=A0A1S2P2W1_9ACTN|nr:ABC transporter permease [Streptomyces colonosanans]OIJ87886.1 ABC transporter permease [Streptomyces colonosanans]
MTNGLARASVRFRPASFAGSFVALLLGALIITACGTLLQTGITAHVEAVRYADSPVVVSGDPYARFSYQEGGERASTQIALPERSRVDKALVAKIAARPAVAAVVPDLSFPLQVVKKAGALPALTGRNFSAAALTAADSSATQKRHAPGAGEVVLEESAARAAGLAPGDRLSLIAPGGSGSYVVSGLISAKADGPSVWFADGVAEKLSGHPGTVDAIAVTPRAGVTVSALAGQVRQEVHGRAKVATGDERGAVEVAALTEGKEVLTGVGGSFGGVAALTAVFVVMGTIALATGQRAREFAMLRAIGATPRQIRRTIATEAVILAPVAAALGVLPGLALARWWFGELVDRGAVPEQVSLDVGVLPMVVAVGACLLAALTAGWVAARRPARLRPSQALGEASVERARPGVIRIVMGLAALAGGGVLANLAARLGGSDAANTALGVIMCFLLAVALLGPLLARLCASVLGLPLRAGAAGAAGSLAADNTRAQARRLASAITPIIMVTAFCGTLLFMQSTIRHASAENVKRAVVADHVLGSTGPGLPATTVERAARVPGVDSATGVLRTGAVYRAGSELNSTTVLGVSGDPGSLPKVLDLGVQSGSLSALGSGTVALDTTIAKDLDVKTGDRVSLRLGDGTKVRPIVVATYERGLGVGGAVMPRAAVAAHVTAALDSQVLIAATPGADRQAMARQLTALAPGATVTDAAGYGAQADRDQELNAWANTVMAAVLGGFAAVAAANTLVMTVLDRRREIGLLRLSGTTRRQVRDMMSWEALLVAVSGLVVGGAIAWTTLVPIARGLTGAAPYIPIGTAGQLVAGAVLLSLAATGLPTLALLRTRPIEAGSARQ